MSSASVPVASVDGPTSAAPQSAVSDLTATCGILRLGKLTCKWPIGEPKDAAFGFCGRRIAGPHTPYCQLHDDLAYQVEPRRRTGAAPGKQRIGMAG